MNKEEFKQKRVEGRKQLLERIIDTFKSLDPVAIYIFGSGSKGFKDEFSDIDIWVTFKDSQIENKLKKLPQIFKSIAPVLIRHYSKSWSPVGGSANSVIHDTEYGLFVVDYYVSKESETVIREDATVIFGDHFLKRGEWRLNKSVNKNIHDSHSIRRDLDLLIDLIFISTKGIVRKWKDDSFITTLKTVHKNFRERYKNIPRRHINLSFKSSYRLLNDLYRVTNKSQKRTIFKIKKYIKQVENLYY